MPLIRLNILFIKPIYISVETCIVLNVGYCPSDVFIHHYTVSITDSGLCPSGQTLGSSRSKWTYSYLVKMFWAVVEFVGLL